MVRDLRLSLLQTVSFQDIAIEKDKAQFDSQIQSSDSNKWSLFFFKKIFLLQLKDFFFFFLESMTLECILTLQNNISAQKNPRNLTSAVRLLAVLYTSNACISLFKIKQFSSSVSAVEDNAV